MKILAFSDLHCDLKQAGRLVEMSSEADVVIGAGDYSSVHKGLEETVDRLASIDKPTLLVPGNNETDDALRSACEEWPVAKVLHGGRADVGRVAFFGLGGGTPTTPWDWSFDLTDEEASAKLAGCPEGGVLIVHSPPRGYLDGSGDTHFGSEEILKVVEDKQPRIVLCGHIHECWGQDGNIGNSRIFNLGPDGKYIEI